MSSDPKAVIHFGMHKTGTSSIQESLFRNLADGRFHYVNLGAANASPGVVMAFKADLGGYGPVAKRGVPAAQFPALRARALARLDAELSGSAGKIAIVSGEDISQLAEDELGALRGFMESRGRPAAPVAYVRRPGEYMESAFQQRVRGGLDRLRAGKLFPRYRARFAKFDAVFGRENVQLSLFDTRHFPGGCVVRDFCARLGVELRPDQVVRANDGLPLPALALLYAYRKWGPGFGVGPAVVRENRLLVEKLRTLPGPKLRLHSSLVAPVIEQRRAETEWMEERLGISLAEDLAARDEGAVRSEEDLLRFTPESLRWLAEALGGDHAARWSPHMSPQEVAHSMHQLRARLAGADEKLQRIAARAAGPGGGARRRMALAQE